MENKKNIGNKAENIAKSFLESKGYIIITSNFFTKLGEIDIIASDNDYLVFVEVKYRKSLKNGLPREAVNYKKQLHIIKTAQYYLMKNNIYNTNCRFDVVEIFGNLEKPEINLIQNAFGL